MTPDDLAKIAKPWIKLLGLGHWRIEYAYGGLGGGDRASIVFLGGHHTAKMRVYEDWDDESLDRFAVPLESIVLHELLELVIDEFYVENGVRHRISERFERVLFDLKEGL